MEKKEYVDNVLEAVKKLDYLVGMLEKLPEDSGISVAEGKRDRWIGFIQGALWSMNLGEIDQFREDIREGRAVEALEEFFNER